MNPKDPQLKTRPDPDPSLGIEIQPSSPRYPLTPRSSDAAQSAFASGATGPNRKIAIAVDLSDESAFAVQWAVQNYLRPGDAVTMLHVRPTSILYGADWGSTHFSVESEGGAEDSRRKIEDDFDKFTAAKVAELAQPLVDAKIPFKVHIVKDHDMKERLCLEIERLGLSTVIMGSRGFGASRRTSKARLGSVSDYCVHHCICPVVVVRYPEDKDGGDGLAGESGSLHPVPEEHEYQDAAEEHEHDHKD